MIGRRLTAYRDRVLDELHRSLVEEHSPKEVARSFSAGTFITMLPTLGTGLVLFIVLVYLFSWVNKVALFASVIVFNPVVKWGVYAASFSLGVLLLGSPVEEVSLSEVSVDAGGDILLRLLVGNLILAVAATIVAYFLAYRLALSYERSSVSDVVEDAIDGMADEELTD